MSYAKIPRVIQDAALGFQSVNAAQDNEQALHDAYALEHRIAVPGSSIGGIGTITGSLFLAGSHNTVLIPRAVGTVRTQTVTLINGQTTQQYWFDVLSANGNYIATTSLARLGDGFYFVATKATDDETVWIDATPAGGASDVRFMSTRYFSTLSGAPVTGAIVRGLQLNSGTGMFEGADFDFSLVLFSR